MLLSLKVATFKNCWNNRKFLPWNRLQSHVTFTHTKWIQRAKTFSLFEVKKSSKSNRKFSNGFIYLKIPLYRFSFECNWGIENMWTPLVCCQCVPVWISANFTSKLSEHIHTVFALFVCWAQRQNWNTFKIHFCRYSGKNSPQQKVESPCFQ